MVKIHLHRRWILNVWVQGHHHSSSKSCVRQCILITNKINAFQVKKESVTNVVGPIDKKPEEDDVEYYNRILQKKPNESEEEFEKRVTVIKKHSPQLPIWKNDLYKNYITTVDSKDVGEEEVVTTTTTKTIKKQSPTKSSPTETHVSLYGQT